MTVADNIGFGVRLQRVSENECQERVQELVLLMGLEGFDKLRPHELSPSQRQRVTLARAMAPRPALLLLDEPFAEAGAKTGRRLGVAVKEWQRGLGTPVILVTRDRRDTMELGDRVAVMCAGRIEQVDTPENLHKSPATEFVARFVGRTGEFHAAPHAGSGGVGHGFPGDAGLPVAVSAPLRNGNGHATGRPIPRGGLSYTFLGRKVNMEVEVALASRVAERAQPSSATSTTDPTPEGPVPLSVGPYRVAPLRLPARNGATNGSAEHATESPG
jgi:energy-coupling factor transporter ATP-binding protein EcfA2